MTAHLSQITGEMALKKGAAVHEPTRWDQFLEHKGMDLFLFGASRVDAARRGFNILYGYDLEAQDFYQIRALMRGAKQ